MKDEGVTVYRVCNTCDRIVLEKGHDCGPYAPVLKLIMERITALHPSYIDRIEELHRLANLIRSL